MKMSNAHASMKVDGWLLKATPSKVNLLQRSPTYRDSRSNVVIQTQPGAELWWLYVPGLPTATGGYDGLSDYLEKLEISMPEKEELIDALNDRRFYGIPSRYTAIRLLSKNSQEVLEVGKKSVEVPLEI